MLFYSGKLKCIYFSNHIIPGFLFFSENSTIFFSLVCCVSGLFASFSHKRYILLLEGEKAMKFARACGFRFNASRRSAGISG